MSAKAERYLITVFTGNGRMYFANLAALVSTVSDNPDEENDITCNSCFVPFTKGDNVKADGRNSGQAKPPPICQIHKLDDTCESCIQE